MTIRDLMRLCDFAGLWLLVSDAGELRIEGEDPRPDQVEVIEANRVALELVLQNRARMQASPHPGREHLLNQLLALDATMPEEAKEGKRHVD